MAANDEFPRGWIESTAVIGAGGLCNIVMPATPGIAHVLTFLEFIFANQGAGAGASNNIAITDTVNILYQIGLAVVPTGIAKDDISWNGKIIGAVGAPLAVLQNAVNPAGYASSLNIQGYDI